VNWQLALKSHKCKLDAANSNGFQSRRRRMNERTNERKMSLTLATPTSLLLLLAGWLAGACLWWFVAQKNICLRDIKQASKTKFFNNESPSLFSECQNHRRDISKFQYVNNTLNV